MNQKQLDEILKKVQGLPDDYWVKRFRELEKIRQGMVEDLKKEFSFMFSTVYEQTIADIESFYAKYNVDGIVPFQVAGVGLTRAEVAEIKAKIKVLEDELKELGLELSDEIKDQINNISTKTARLDGLKLLIMVRCDYLYTLLADHIATHMETMTNEGHDRTIYEVFKACGYGTKDISSLSDEEMAVILAIIWRSTEESFGDVVKRYGKTFATETTQYLGRCCFSPTSYSDIELYLARRFNVKVSELNQMLVTDSTFYATQGQTKAFNELEITKVIFTAILDERTSDMCREADGNVIPVEDIVPWENAPPLHFNCRSTLRGIVEQVDFLTGETYELDVDYDGWYSKYYSI